MPTTPEVAQPRAVSHTGWEVPSARMPCGRMEGSASGRPQAHDVVQGQPGTDLQRVYPLEAGVLHGQEDGAVLQGWPAAQEESRPVERLLQGHQVQ